MYSLSHYLLYSCILSWCSDSQNNGSIEVIKPDADHRLYRGFTLKNGLQALVISDPSTPMAAAALSVNTGNWHDPIDMPGLAHYTEHMLFLGSDRYPEESAYQNYVLGHGGGTNGYTISEETNFHFRVESAFLFGSLDRFSSFFVSPLMREEAMSREMNAVSSEFAKNFRLDERRFAAVLAYEASSHSPLTHFTTGNVATLNKSDVHERVMKYYENHFNANNMKLVVYGRDSLNKLEADVRKLFGDIPNHENACERCQQTRVFNHPPFIPGKNVPSLTFLQPINQRSHVINLYFPLKSLAFDSKHRIGEYVCWLLESEADGSIVDMWRKAGKLHHANATLTFDSPSFTLVQYQLTLNLEALDESDFATTQSDHSAQSLPSLVEEIIDSTFSYLHSLRTEAEQPMRERYEEWRELNLIDWMYSENQPAYQVAVELAKRLQRDEFQYVLEPPQRLEFSQTAFLEVLDQITPNNLVLHIASPSTPKSVYDKHEPWYGVPFANSTMPTKLIERWESVPLVTLPHADRFIPTNFTIADPEPSPVTHPRVLFENECMQLYYNQAISSELPLGFFYLMLHNGQIQRDVHQVARFALWVAVAQDALATQLYLAKQAGYSVNIQAMPSGLTLSLSGVSSGLPKVLDEVLAQVFSDPTEIKVEPLRFTSIKQSLISSLREVDQKQPYSQAIYLLSLYLEENKFPNEQLIAAIEPIEQHDSKWDAFVAKFVSNSFVQMFAYGSVTEASSWDLAYRVIGSIDAVDGSRIHQWTLPTKQNITLQLPTHSMLLPPPGVYVIDSEVFDHNANSAVIVEFYMGSYSNLESSVLTDMIALLITQPAFSELRTRQQLGYIVHTWALTRFSSERVLRFAVQSSVYSAPYLFDRVNDFLINFYSNVLSQLTHDAWLQSKGVLLIAAQESNDSMNERSAHQWTQITTQEGWKRKEREIKQIQSIKFDQVMDYYHKRLLNPDTRRMYVVQMHSNHGTHEQTNNQTNGALDLPDAVELPLSNSDRLTWKKSVGVDESTHVHIHIHAD